MKIVVLDAATLGDDLDLSPLNELGEVVVYNETAAADIAVHISDAEVVVCNKPKLTRENLSQAHKLRLIAETATGYDNIDVSYCREAGIGVANIAGYSTASVVQVTIATALELATHLAAYRAHVASGTYSRGKCFNYLKPVYHELTGKTWGIIGYGNIGRQVGCVAEALGCRVIAYTRTPCEDVKCVDLETLCRQSDIISIHVPLTDATRGMIHGETLSYMKRGVILINEARGAVVDEAAVAVAARNGDIYYGCDVYSSEPFPSGHPYQEIKALDNVCLTPHMAWGAFEARTRCLAEIVENIKAYKQGKRRNRVD